jgi:fatty-acyl-CoA synthase
MLYGCGKIGAVVICLNWRLSVDELKGVLGDAQPVALVWGEEFDVAGTALVDALKIGNRMVTGAARPQVAGYESALAEMSGATVEMPWREHNDVWYLLYTAGSTGKPKGVPQTWGMNVTNTLTNTIHASLRRDDVMLSVLPYFHTGGLNLYMNCLLMLGATTLIMRQFDVDKTMELLEKEAHRDVRRARHLPVPQPASPFRRAPTFRGCAVGRPAVPRCPGCCSKRIWPRASPSASASA